MTTSLDRIGARLKNFVAAAAAALLGAVVLSACSGGKAPSAGLTTTTASTGTTIPLLTTVGPGGPGTTPTTTAAGPVRYDQPGKPTKLAPGRVTGVSPDGQSLYVEAVDSARSKRGCEGELDPVVFRQPLDGSGREVATSDDAAHGTILRGGNGKVAVVGVCEEFLTAVWVGTESPDGHLRDLKKLTFNQAPNALSFAWAVDSSALLAVRGTAVVRVDAASGDVATLFDLGSSGGSQVDQLVDGTFVLDVGGQVRLRDAVGRVQATVPGTFFTVGPDRRTIAVYGSDGLGLLTQGQTQLRKLADGQIASAQFSPDGRAIAFSRSSGGGAGGSEVLVVPTGSGATGNPASVATGRAAGPFFASGGRILAFSDLADGSVQVAKFV